MRTAFVAASARMLRKREREKMQGIGGVLVNAVVRVIPVITKMGFVYRGNDYISLVAFPFQTMPSKTYMKRVHI